MSYGLKYTASAISKDGSIYTINVYERDYVGAVTIWQTAPNPFVKSYLAESDDLIDPFLPSTLEVNIAQSESFNLPDVQTFDDRKYYAELVTATTVHFKGFLLNDSISLPFTTGEHYINMKFADGLAILKNIEFPAPLNNSPISLDTSKLVSLLDVVLICIRSLEYDVNINIATSIFANGMLDRGDGTANEPLSQSYLPLRDFLNTQITFLSCYECLELILKSFQAQIIQDEGEFWFVSQYERDNASTVFNSLYFTKYDQNGNVITSGRKRVGVNINAYPTEPYFIENTQNKILRKGFNNVVLNNPNKYAVEMLSNPFLIIGDGLSADYWTIDTPTYTNYSLPGAADFPFYTTDLTSGSIAPNVLSGVFSQTNFDVNVGDSINFSFFINGGGGPDTNLPDALASIILNDGIDAYYWATNANGDVGWVKNAGGNDVYYQVAAQSTLNGTKTSVRTTAVPVSGTITVGVYLKKNVSNSLASYGQFSCTVESGLGSYQSVSSLGSVGTLSGSTITLASAYTFNEGRKLKLIIRDSTIENSIYSTLVSQSGLTLTLDSSPRTGYTVFVVTQDFQYKKETEIKIGITGRSLSLSGVLLDSNGVAWNGWYRFGQVEAYDSLFDLLNIIYANQLAYNQINMDCIVYSIRPTISSFSFTDPTDGYNITGKWYLFGNMTVNYTENTMSGIFLEVNGDDVDVVRYNIYNSK